MTTKKQIGTEIDGILLPLGFERQKDTWNRRQQAIVEVVDIEVGKSRGGITLNAGVLDFEIYTMVWGKNPGQFVDIPSCTVQARIGELIDGLDKWWPLSDVTIVAEINHHVVQYILPFTGRMANRAGMKQWLEATAVARKRYPPPILSLAVLSSFLGDSAKACQILKELGRKTTGAWQSTVSEIARNLGCAPMSSDK